MRLVTRRRLREMESERERLRQQVADCQSETREAVEREVATQLRLAGEADELSAQLSNAAFAREVAESANTRLREEITELVQEVERLSTTPAVPSLVYILFHVGQLHSVHTSREAARAEAERLGAPRSGWEPLSSNTPLSGSGWQVHPLQLHPDPVEVEQ